MTSNIGARTSSDVNLALRKSTLVEMTAVLTETSSAQSSEIDSMRGFLLRIETRSHGTNRGQTHHRARGTAFGEENQNHTVARRETIWLRKALTLKMEPDFARVIQDEIKSQLSDEILFGQLQKGGDVHIGVKKDSLFSPIRNPS